MSNTGKVLPWLSRLWHALKKMLQLFTIFLHYLWLLFPGILSLVLAWFCFWNLHQGVDITISSTEGPWRGSILLIALVFWVLATWYTSRLLVYKKESLFHAGKKLFPAGYVPPKGLNMSRILYYSSEFLGIHLPRFLGYTCFSLMILAYTQLPVLKDKLTSSEAGLCLLLYVSVYILLYAIFLFTGRRMVKRNLKKWLAGIYWLSLAVLILLVLKPLYAPSFRSNEYAHNTHRMIWTLLILQHLYLFLIVNRKKLTENVAGPSQDKTTLQKDGTTKERIITKVLRFVNIPYTEGIFFLVFNIISIAAIVIYIRGVFNMHFAHDISSIGFVILSFGILVGYFGLVSVISIHTAINFHLLIFVLVVILGKTREPHYVRLYDKQLGAPVMARPSLRTYFLHWAHQHEAAIRKDTAFPVFFILADGGASRSGYWAASVLGRLHDQTQGRFAEHLFCLSGASGGSVGNGTYFALLHYQDSLKGKSLEKAAKDYLQNDFLSYTVARMMGPDFFKPLLPVDLKHMPDRAGALETVMETGQDDTVFLKNKLATPFSSFITDTSNIRLPVICINTTRMQDGRPGVISNILIEDPDATFGKRIDVLKLVTDKKDMNLSTAMVLGARFPYISPAGRIDDTLNSNSRNSYFVDGGYFDNSGAGVVHEMIMSIKDIIKDLQLKDSSLYSTVRNLRFYVIHITNSPFMTKRIEKIHFLRNDLMSPVLTLIGSYGTQTDVNDSRLEKYMQSVYFDNKHYLTADLYSNISPDSVRFPMNWSISDYYRNKMNDQLNNSRQLQRLAAWISGVTKK